MSELPPSTALRCERDGHQRNARQTRVRQPAAGDAPHTLARRGTSHHLAFECAGIGSAVGGTLGVLAATLLVTVTMSLFGIGMAGPLAAALVGAVGGAAAGGALGVWLDRCSAARRRDDLAAALREGAASVR